MTCHGFLIEIVDLDFCSSLYAVWVGRLAKFVSGD